ncbi:MAG TPA: SpoIIE family protein phosphatase, partial [Acidobacteriaceae bacterium]|nr:SpoIIE family protein phosphatase [Acidobacteriaceae bacterium]
PSAAADPRPGRTYRLGTESTLRRDGKIVWLRATVTPSEELSNPALLVNPNAGDCQVFVNGQKAADCGNWPRTTSSARRWLLVRLPAGAAQIAIRIAGPVGGSARVPRDGDVLFGGALTLEAIRTATDANHLYKGLAESLLSASELLGGMILLLVFHNDRREREYLWFAAFLLLDGSMSLEAVVKHVYPLLPQATGTLTDALGMIGRYAPLVGFIAAFTGVRLSRWMRGYQILLLVIPVLISFPFLSEKFAELLPQVTSRTFGVILLFVQLPFIVGSLGFLGWKWKRGNREAGLLLPSFLLASAFEVLGIIQPSFWTFQVGRFGFDYDDLSMFFFLVSIGPVLLSRHRRMALEHERTKAELEAAQRVQTLLLHSSPTSSATIWIENVYRPAQEVGGDFFHTTVVGGQHRIVIGDVSGKGLGAAMLVSAIIGALDTLRDAAPARVLHSLNDLLLARQQGGFATCLCAIVTPGGEIRMANAGHLAPYHNGSEVAVESGLPLGLTTGIEYAEVSLRLAAGDRLAFLSDGVVEARNSTGELFGFERTRAISAGSADKIASAAQAFGQIDDITVLTVAVA